MIKTIPFKLDGFSYNIIQMNGVQAWTLKISIINLISALNIDRLKSIDTSDQTDKTAIVLELIQAICSNLQAKTVIPIIQELLSTVRFIKESSDLSTIEASGFDVNRHTLPPGAVHLDQFVGKDMIHVPFIIYEVLRANYADFFLQLKQKLGSNFGQNIQKWTSQIPVSP